MGGLQQQMESQGLKNVVYMVINHQGEQSQLLHPLLADRLSKDVALYKQDEQRPDVWQTLGGEKDDFLIYDRCGRLTHRISLPYSIIGQGHIEEAIKDTYCKRICGECTHESAETPEECKEKADPQPEVPAVPDDTRHGQSHEHHHGHGHGHHHGHHGDNHGFHPRGFGHDRDHNHGHHHGNHNGAGHGSDYGQSQHDVRPQGHDQEGGMSQTQHHLDLGQIQQPVHNQQMVHGSQDRP